MRSLFSWLRALNHLKRFYFYSELLIDYFFVLLMTVMISQSGSFNSSLLQDRIAAGLKAQYQHPSVIQNIVHPG